MDKVEVRGEGTSHTFTLTIESHQSLITSATNQTYLDQKKYDPADTSQDYAVSIANGDPAPNKHGAWLGGDEGFLGVRRLLVEKNWQSN